ncbi:MAG: hypothetical protein Q9174_001557 [Haloplaca sp. 1 TL-2023]
MSTETGEGLVAPHIVYYTLRLMMFILSFVLEDWAIHELVPSPRERKLAVVLVASSYVTWTYQTHTFSNAIETLIVLWSIVMTQRILDNKASSKRIQAIAIDTHFYRSSLDSLLQLLRNDPVITPLNSILYNTSTANLSLHGLHPPYQHLVASLPLLFGPALLLLYNVRRLTLPILSAFSATLLLSLIPHQEPRFLLPAVPLILSSIRLPNSRTVKNCWLGSWIVFNAIFGVLMGIYHQGGVVPAQLWLGQHEPGNANAQVFWWRTYSPPMWLLGGKEIPTVDLMGMKTEEMKGRVLDAIGDCQAQESKGVGLVAPRSSVELDVWQKDVREELTFEQLWLHTRHLNLDDLDFEEDGIWGTLERVVGRRGLVIWKIRRNCSVDNQ